jgi:hypothetical protein
MLGWKKLVRYVVRKGSMNVKETLQIYPHRKASILIRKQKYEESSDFFFFVAYGVSKIGAKTLHINVKNAMKCIQFGYT